MTGLRPGDVVVHRLGANADAFDLVLVVHPKRVVVYDLVRGYRLNFEASEYHGGWTLLPCGGPR